MRGQSAITELRLCGYKPRIVWVLLLDSGCPENYFLDAANSLELDGKPEVHVSADDDIAALDFRFVHGLTVLLQGNDPARLRTAFKRIRQFSPERIITSSRDIFNDYRHGHAKRHSNHHAGQL
ncbi:hypothetical protein [Alcaligenes endophyticus]|uniref:Uncharacterized protein n=1 Tax=Alcaligenes endophyticus TaxID=1929088 RepID=A0ABT8EIW9_9BURK|nr:hypothetical protein [Alcaligenes endophyticus]MCX5592512.1 hypothetical protein [Alcaligenes endophyticus]MDN4121238.1 hypothetical protein [Alcaligenes endophyticus]